MTLVLPAGCPLFFPSTLRPFDPIINSVRHYTKSSVIQHYISSFILSLFRFTSPISLSFPYMVRGATRSSPSRGGALGEGGRHLISVLIYGERNVIDYTWVIGVIPRKRVWDQVRTQELVRY